jgi:hypothetical protein
MKTKGRNYLYYSTIPIVIILLILIQINSDVIQNGQGHLMRIVDSFKENKKSEDIESVKIESKFKMLRQSNQTFRIKSKRYALMSSTLDDNYTFNIPVVVHAWRRINIEPIVLIIKDENQFKYKENSSSGQILEYLNRMNVQTLFIKVNQNFSIVISQVIRMFIGIFPDDIIQEDDFVMTTDSDLAPLKLAYYYVDMSRINTTITVWNAYCCGSFQHVDNKTYRMFPMGHVGMTKKNWRMAIGLNKDDYTFDGDSVLKMLSNIYGKDFKQDEAKGGLSWYADQSLISVYVNVYAANNNKTLDLRAYSGMRLDRTVNEDEWNGKLANLNELTDAHLYQWQRESFIRLFKNFLLKCFANETNLINFYQELFFKYWKFN